MITNYFKKDKKNETQTIKINSISQINNNIDIINESLNKIKFNNFEYNDDS